MVEATRILYVIKIYWLRCYKPIVKYISLAAALLYVCASMVHQPATS